MRPADEIRRLMNKAAVSTNPTADKAVLDTVLMAQRRATDEASAVAKPSVRSIIMRNSYVRLALAAVVVLAVVLGLAEFLGTGTGSGVVWAQVAQQVDHSRGVIYRMRETYSDEPSGPDYALVYSAATRERADYYKDGRIVLSLYADFDTRTLVRVLHENKRYIRDTQSLSQRMVQERRNWIDPKGWVRKFLSCTHIRLEPRMIEGTRCEGLETIDPAFFGREFPIPISSLDVQLWVSIQTGYPVLFQGEIVCGKDGQRRIEGTADQFQWDVEFDPNALEPQIPSGYNLE